MKLDSRGYIIDKKTATNQQLRKIERDLIVKPFVPGNRGKFMDNSFAVYQENEDEIAIPRFYGVENFGEPTKNLLGRKTVNINVKYKGKMRPRQEIAVSNIMEGFNKFGGGIVNAGCGSGKTNIAIYVACKLGLKTLFVVHKDFLRDQIKDRIMDFTDCTDIGIIQGKKMDTDHPFVIATVQTCIKREIDRKILREFGLIIFDEAHHMAAKNFHLMFYKICPPYILGLTAETSRPDGLYKVINWFIGPVLHREPQSKNDKVIVKCFWFRSSDRDNTKTIIKYGDPDRVQMITNLCEIHERNRAAFNIIFSLFDQEHTILVLSGRKEQLNSLHQKLEKNEYTKGSSGLFHGEIPKKDQQHAKNKQIILATYDMVEEGFNKESLTAVLLLTPRGKVNQSTGRILRKEEYDYNPLIITMYDEEPKYFHNSYNKQISYFKDQHYTIYRYNISDTKEKDSIYYRDLESISDSLENHRPENLFWKYGKSKKKETKEKEEKKEISILITGARDWNSENIIRHAFEWLLETFPSKQITIIHSGCTGADAIAENLTKEYGFANDKHPADWSIGKKSSPKMIELKPDYVFAFHNYLEGSKGTKDTVTKAHKADIPVRLFTKKLPGGEILPNLKVRIKPMISGNYFANKGKK